MRYDLLTKPSFKEGDKVSIDMKCLVPDTDEVRTGTILGIGSENVVDMWIVQFDEKLPHYRFSTVVLPHTCFLKP